MKTRYFYNTENEEIYTLEDLKEIFKTWLAEDASEEEKEIYSGNFGYWLNACMTRNNGVLDEFYI